jgi:hypothetical protein
MSGRGERVRSLVETYDQNNKLIYPVPNKNIECLPLCVAEYIRALSLA